MSNSVREHVVEEFAEVFRDELSKEPMRFPEIRIALRDNAVPSVLFHNSSPGSPPLPGSC